MLQALPRVALALALAHAIGVSPCAGAPLVSEVAVAAARPDAAPKYSDVCFSTRWPRPRNDKDPTDAIAIARQFHATRFEWLYVSGRADYVTKLKGLGFSVSGAVNTTLPDKPGTRDYQQGRAVDLDGELLIAPWMTAWGTYWGCFNRPEYRRTYLEAAKLDVDAGVDALQMDGSGGNTHLPAWGGCFCTDCIAGFQTYLAENSTDAQREDWAVGDPVQFDGRHNMLAVPGFANAHLAGRGFTFILVSQSDEGQFGVSGNALNGSGGDPRLYVTREMLIYDRLRQRLSSYAGGNAANIVTYTYDGTALASAFVNTMPAPAGPLREMASVAKFGGGNLSIPFCSGGVNRSGDLAELIIYDRALTEAERRAVEMAVAQRNGIRALRRWKLTVP